MAFLSTTRNAAALGRGSRASLLDLFSLYRQRRALARLDARDLEDIGISGKEAEKEARRGFWDVPDHWLK